jgi:hypothetical protein
VLVDVDVAEVEDLDVSELVEVADVDDDVDDVEDVEDVEVAVDEEVAVAVLSVPVGRISMRAASFLSCAILADCAE